MDSILADDTSSLNCQRTLNTLKKNFRPQEINCPTPPSQNSCFAKESAAPISHDHDYSGLDRMKLSCANRSCELGTLTASDARVEIKATLPDGWSDNVRTCHVLWKRDGEATFHLECWKSVLKTARSRRSGSATVKHIAVGSAVPAMLQAEKMMIKEAAKTMETFDSEEDIRRAAKEAAALICKARHCIAFTGAGISTSAGLGDFRGKSGKWTEEDRAFMDGAIHAAFQNDISAASASSSTANPPAQDGASRAARERNVGKAATQSQESGRDCDKAVEEDLCPGEEPTSGAEESVDYEHLRPTYTHEALNLLLEKGLMHYVVSQNCDGLHLLSGLPPDRISELHGNVFVEKCPKCEKRYSRNFYVLHDEASQYYEELADFGETEVVKPSFAIKCKLCGLCHRTGRRCEEKGCSGFLEDTIINFCDNLEDSVLDRAMEQACQSDVILCLGTTLTVTPAASIVEQARGLRPLIICNRQKTEKEQLAQVRVFGDCDVFMHEVLAQVIDGESKSQWEKRRGERMREYNIKRETGPTKKRRRSSIDDPAVAGAGVTKVQKRSKKK